MKGLIRGLVCVVGLAGTGAAFAQPIEVQARVRHGGVVLAAPRVVVQSGAVAMVEVGALRLTVRPTQTPNGTVEIESVLATDQTIASPIVRVAPGKTATIQVGDWELALTPTVGR